MTDPRPRNPVVTAFARGERQRHQVHQDRRRQRRPKHRSDPFEFDAE